MKAAHADNLGDIMPHAPVTDDLMDATGCHVFLTLTWEYSLKVGNLEY